MVAELAAMAPLVPPGTRTLYQSMTHGWLIGEIVRRTDPAFAPSAASSARRSPNRSGSAICGSACPTRPRRAGAAGRCKTDRSAKRALRALGAATGRHGARGVRAAGCARRRDRRRRRDLQRPQLARFWAMLAEGGALDDVRLLSGERTAGFNRPLGGPEDPDIAAFGGQLPSIDGFWLGGPAPAVAAAKHPSAICHPGGGNSMGWADPATRLGAAICHNRLSEPGGADATLELASAIRVGLGLD